MLKWNVYDPPMPSPKERLNHVSDLIGKELED